MTFFVVPGTPVAWARVKRSSQGVAYVPTKTREFKKLVAVCARAACVEFIKDGPVYLRVIGIWECEKKARKKVPWPRRWKPTQPDYDNIEKSIADGLQGVAFRNDGQVCMGRCITLYGAQGEAPSTRVWVGGVRTEAPQDDMLECF